jgi:hypothetical protein
MMRLAGERPIFREIDSPSNRRLQRADDSGVITSRRDRRREDEFGDRHFPINDPVRPSR